MTCHAPWKIYLKIQNIEMWAREFQVDDCWIRYELFKNFALTNVQPHLWYCSWWSVMLDNPVVCQQHLVILYKLWTHSWIEDKQAVWTVCFADGKLSAFWLSFNKHSITKVEHPNVWVHQTLYMSFLQLMYFIFQSISMKFLKDGFFLNVYLCTKGEPNWRNVLH